MRSTAIQATSASAGARPRRGRLIGLRRIVPIVVLGLLAGLVTAVPAQAVDADVRISEFMASNTKTLLDADGAASDWIELHNTGAEPVDLTGWTITDTATLPAQWTFPAVQLAPDGYLVIFASGKNRTVGELHTNFKLSGSGEYLGLRSASGSLIDEYAPTFPAQYSDVSYGLAGATRGFFATPTPGAANGAPYAGITTGAVSFSLPHGVYSSEQTVTLTSTQAGGTIKYTTDGSTPSETNGLDYGGPLTISSTTTLRATPVVAGYLPGKVTTASYIFLDDVITQSATPPPTFPTGTVNTQSLNYGMDPTFVTGHEQEVKAALSALPTMSVVTDSANLFDPTTGIYVNAVQKGSAWERPTSLELIDPSGAQTGFTTDAGVRIKGGASRSGTFPKHSWSFYFRPEYGGALSYPLFQNEGASSFTKIELKTVQSWSWVKGVKQTYWINDVFMRASKGALGRPTTRSRYYHVMLNGQYWGLYYIQEEFGKDYATTYLGGQGANYDVVTDDRNLGFATSADEGTLDAWNSMFPLISDRQVTDAEYATLSTQVDIANLIDTFILEAYVGNGDGSPSRWLGNYRGNNWQAMRDRTGGKWIFNIDDGEDTLGMSTNDATVNRVGPWLPLDKTYTEGQYFHPDWLHDALLSNAQYRDQFHARAVQVLADDGPLGAAASRARWQALAAQVRPALLAEAARWSDYSTTTAPPTPADWESAIAWVDANWFDSRPSVAATQLKYRGAPNLAAGKTATMSSTVDATGAKAASVAIDGVTASGFAHTAYESQPYWQVDLGSYNALSEVVLYNRSDCCQDRLANVHVLTSSLPITGRTLAEAKAQTGVSDHVVTGRLGQITPVSIGGRTARYVRVQLEGTNYLTLPEVLVTGTPTTAPPIAQETNLALGKTATQSSTGWSGNAPRAVDGNTSGVFPENSVTHTISESSPWWQVDLGTVSRLNTIKLYNRTDCCSTRLTNVHVFVSDTPITGTTVAEVKAQPGVLDYYQTGALGALTQIGGLAQGRYVRVQLDGTGYLSLAEVEVFGLPTTVANVALGKTATQSSTGWAGVASRAVDGNTSGVYSDNSITHTVLEASPWWQVDLGAEYDLSKVTLFNRTGCCSERLSNVHVFASTTPITGTTVAAATAQAGVTHRYLTGALGARTDALNLGAARYLRIQLDGSGYLSLAELQAFGVPTA